MLLPRFFATGLWLAATVGSTALVWAATSVVAADVTDRPPAVVALQDVVNELEAGPVPATAPTSTTQAPRPSGPTSTAPSPGGGSTPPSPQAPLPAAPRPAQPGVTFPSSPPTTPPPSLPARPASPPTTQRAPRPTATYSTTGGVVKVACDGFFIDLIFAIPSNGYSVKVVAAGPGNVDVRFVRSGREVSVKAACFGQPFRYYEQSPPREAPSP